MLVFDYIHLISYSKLSCACLLKIFSRISRKFKVQEIELSYGILFAFKYGLMILCCRCSRLEVNETKILFFLKFILKFGLYWARKI